MTYAILGIVVAFVVLFVHSVVVRLLAGFILFALFALFLIQSRARGTTSPRKYRIAFAISCASALAGLWDIAIAIYLLRG